MTNKKHIITFFFSTIIFGLFLLLALWRLNPSTINWTGQLAVAVLLAFFLTYLFGTVLLSYRYFRKINIPSRAIFRQSLFLAIVIVLALYLQRFGLLTWWNMAILLVITALLEIFFIGHREQYEEQIREN